MHRLDCLYCLYRLYRPRRYMLLFQVPRLSKISICASDYALLAAQLRASPASFSEQVRQGVAQDVASVSLRAGLGEGRARRR